MSDEARFRIAQPDDAASWDRFVTASPQGSVFSRPCFFDAHGGVDFEPWLVSRGEDVILGAVLVKDAAGQVLSAGYPFARPEIFFSASALTLPVHRRTKECLEAMQALLAHLENRYACMRYRCHPAIDDVRAFQWFHYRDAQAGRFRIDVRLTGWVDLQSVADFDGYLAQIRPTRRNEYRQALRHGLTAEVTSDVQILDHLHRLTFERQGLERDAVESALLMRIAAAAARGNFGEIMVARAPGGEPVSATLFLYDHVAGHYVAGANHPEHRKFFGGTFCFLESVRHCIARRLRRVDVCGINSPNRGDFKTSFNAGPKPYFEAMWLRPAERAA